MPSRRQLRIAEIREIASRHGWQQVDPEAFAVLRGAFPEASERTLRHSLRESGIPLHPLVEGVRLDSLEDLARTLLALARLYQMTGPGPAQTGPARAEVLAARRKVEWILRNPRVPEQAHKEAAEKLLWLRVWLENPPLFAGWLQLRQATLRNPQPGFKHPLVGDD